MSTAAGVGLRRSLGAHRLRTWSLRGLLALGGVALDVLGAEAVLRVFDLAPSQSVYTVTEAQFPLVPGIFEPQQSAVQEGAPGLRHRVTINALGYRGAPLAREKPPGERRIFYAGDSYAFGFDVNDGDTLPAQLESVLGARCPGVRVINAGLASSTIDAQSALVERGLVLRPDLVVLQFFENDISDLDGKTVWQQLAENRAAKSRFPLSWIYPVARRTALWNLAVRTMVLRSARAHAAQTAAVGSSLSPGEPREAELRERYRSRLLELKETLSARGLPFVMTAFPSNRSVYGAPQPELLDWIRAVARDSGIPYFDLLEPLRRSGLSDTDLYLLPADDHPSPRGYRVAAEALRDALLGEPRAAALCERPGA